MRHRLFVHVVWTTRDRLPSLDAQRATFLVDILPRLALRERGRILVVGMVSTHLHLLIRYHPTSHLPRLVQLLKGTSATVARRDHGLPILWAKGYNVESVSVRALGAVARYIRSQPEHHPSEAIPGFDLVSLGLIPSLRSGHGPGLGPAR